MKEPDWDFILFDGVYPPSEDTFLLLDAVNVSEDDIVLEVGCGSGFITVNLCKIVEKLVALDISLDAVRNTQENLRKNNLSNKCGVIQSNLLKGLSPNCKFSVILFNPPYLPKEDFETKMDQALVGGSVGIEITERFIHGAVMHLQENGSLYVVVSSLADTSKIKQILCQYGFQITTVAEENVFFETLYVLKGIL
ncbi:MAG: HemK2/MTQ2 family protein methyltransferase [Candidatus Thorarchaeota archaeon]